MSDTSLHHVSAPGTASFRDVGTGPNQIIALSSSPGTADGSKFLRDDGVLSNPTGERGPAGNPNPEETWDAGNIGATLTIPASATATVIYGTLTAATCTLTFPDEVEGASFVFIPTQDATGGRTIVLPENALTAGGGGIALSTGANKTDIVTALCHDGVSWLVTVAGYDFR